MDKSEFTKYLKESVQNIFKESRINAGGKTFSINVSVNKNPTKEGIKIQLKPTRPVEMDKDEKAKITLAIQEKFNNSLESFNLQVNEDPDIRQATDNPNVLGYYIPLEQIRQLIIRAIKDKPKEREF